MDKRLVAASLVIPFLVACGGGGGGDAPPPAQNSNIDPSPGNTTPTPSPGTTPPAQNVLNECSEVSTSDPNQFRVVNCTRFSEFIPSIFPGIYQGTVNLTSLICQVRLFEDGRMMFSFPTQTGTFTPTIDPYRSSRDIKNTMTRESSPYMEIYAVADDVNAGVLSFDTSVPSSFSPYGSAYGVLNTDLEPLFCMDLEFISP